MGIHAVILAAGGGTRMKSSLPKPLHRVCGLPMILHVIGSLAGVDLDSMVIVVGHGADQVVECVQSRSPIAARTVFATQEAQRGTGDAASVGLAALGEPDGDDTVLIIPGDTPLLTPGTIARLVSEHTSTPHAATLLTTSMDDPTGYGRIVRDASGNVTRIVEHKDASPEVRAIDEVNAGVYAFDIGPLVAALATIEPNNSQAEYYLTDVIDRLVSGGRIVGAVLTDPQETAGVNDRQQLASADHVMAARIIDAWRTRGVTISNPGTVRIESSVRIGHGVTLLPGVILKGDTLIGDGCVIGPQVTITNSTIGANSSILMSDISSFAVGPNASVGPNEFLGAASPATDDRQSPAFYTGHP